MRLEKRTDRGMRVGYGFDVPFRADLANQTGIAERFDARIIIKQRGDHTGEGQNVPQKIAINDRPDKGVEIGIAIRFAQNTCGKFGIQKFGNVCMDAGETREIFEALPRWVIDLVVADISDFQEWYQGAAIVQRYAVTDNFVDVALIDFLGIDKGYLVDAKPELFDQSIELFQIGASHFPLVV